MSDTEETLREAVTKHNAHSKDLLVDVRLCHAVADACRAHFGPSFALDSDIDARINAAVAAERERINGLAKRFWPKVKMGAGCWEWTGSAGEKGYGYLHSGGKVERKPLRAHRVSWEIHNGSIPDGLWVLHRCDNPRCVRPDHLFLGDRSDNMRDCAAKGRISTIGKARLTHCKRGHEFTPENTHLRPNGHRQCIACRAVDNAKRREKRAAR